MGVGVGATFPAVSIGSMGSIKGQELGLGSGIVNMSRQVGFAIGVALLVAVFTGTIDNQIASARKEVSALDRADARLAAASRHATVGARLRQSAEPQRAGRSSRARRSSSRREHDRGRARARLLRGGDPGGRVRDAAGDPVLAHDARAVPACSASRSPRRWRPAGSPRQRGSQAVPYIQRAMAELDPTYFNEPLAAVDPEIAEVLQRELERQQGTLEMIASENFVPRAILEAAGSVLTNKYAEGFPGKRYYGGCEWVDVSEQLAIDRAKELFGAEHANVQPHAGAQANNAVYMALLEPGDTILGMELAHGGHLTHGMKLNVSGKLYEVVGYQVRREDHRVDMEQVERLAKEHRPKLIVAGWSAYPRQLDFAEFRRIADEVGAKLMVDMAHFAGLVAAGEHPSPVPHARRRHAPRPTRRSAARARA